MLISSIKKQTNVKWVICSIQSVKCDRNRNKWIHGTVTWTSVLKNSQQHQLRTDQSEWQTPRSQDTCRCCHLSSVSINNFMTNCTWLYFHRGMETSALCPRSVVFFKTNQRHCWTIHNCPTIRELSGLITDPNPVRTTWTTGEGVVRQLIYEVGHHIVFTSHQFHSNFTPGDFNSTFSYNSLSQKNHFNLGVCKTQAKLTPSCAGT